MAVSLAVGLLAFGGAPRAEDQEAADGAVFPISRFVVEFGEAHPDQPPLSEMLPLEIELGMLASGFVAPRPGIPTTPVAIGRPRWKSAEDAPPQISPEALPYHASAIGFIVAQLVAALRERGLVGVYAAPDAGQLELASERDLRAAGDTTLRLVIDTARVRALRTIASGDRIQTEWHIDNVVHQRIRDQSPIQPTGAVQGQQTDLVREDVLDDYLFRLNRHPGRRVDAALAPAEDGQGVALDFLVSESKPWYVYAQTSNTGSDATFDWQQRFGYVNNQLTDRDDSLRLEFTNAGDASNGFNFSYEAPWFGATRPWWWGTPNEGPAWLSWVDRSKLPWFGSDSMRWRVWGTFTGYSAEQVQGVVDVDIDGLDWNLGGRLIYNVFQHHAFFIDLFGGMEIRGVKVDNKGAATEANQFFFLPQFGIQSERVNEVSSFFGNLTLEGNFQSIDVKSIDGGGDPSGGLEALGRSNPDDRWMVLNLDAGLSQFLEPLLNPRGWQDPSTTWNSTLAHELYLGLRGQYAFNYRLIPQAEQVLGGLYSVRGYEQSTAVGDNVVIGTFEYRFHLPHSLPVQREPMKVPLLGDFRVSPQQVYGRPDWDLILRAFVDAGVTHRNKRPPQADPCGTFPDPPCAPRLERGDVLVGSGLGAELRIRNYLRVRVDWATALTSSHSVNHPVDVGDQEVHFLFSVLY